MPPTYRELALQTIQTIDAAGANGFEWQEIRARAVDLLGWDPASDDDPLTRVRKGMPPGEPLPEPVSIVYPSRSQGAPHVVTITSAKPPLLTCTCPAFLGVVRALRHQPENDDQPSPPPPGCWAMIRTRQLLGLQG